ncbi:hypothetical protein C5167_041417 [Papaver somniferum]|nr:hypothetical protein C5167_041417 [Papaver somniferum]
MNLDDKQANSGAGMYQFDTLADLAALRSGSMQYLPWLLTVIWSNSLAPHNDMVQFLNAAETRCKDLIAKEVRLGVGGMWSKHEIEQADTALGFGAVKYVQL